MHSRRVFVVAAFLLGCTKAPRPAPAPAPAVADTEERKMQEILKEYGVRKQGDLQFLDGGYRLLNGPVGDFPVPYSTDP